MAAKLAQHLGELELGLEGLLSCFEGEAFPEEPAMVSTWARVLRAFEQVQTELPADAARRETHREQLERCQRLYAVAASLLARRREELAVQRAACGAVRGQLRRARPGGESGGSCNVRA